MMQLGLTLPLRPAQTTTSLVTNIAAFNGSQYVQDFSQDMRLNWKGLVKGLSEELDLVSKLSGVPREQMDKYASRLVVEPGGRKSFVVAEQHLSNRQFARGRLRVCPKCIMEDKTRFGDFGPYTRVYWHVSSIRTCPEHQVALLELPAAEFPRDIHDTFGRIRDHWSLIEAATRCLEFRKPSSFERYQIKRLDGQKSRNWLDELPFEIVAKTSEMLGLVCAFGPQKAFSTASDAELAEAGRLGFEALRKGKQGIEAALSGVQSRSVGFRSGHYTDFCQFARWLDRRTNDERYDPICEIYRDFVFRNYPIGQGEIVLGKPCPQRHLHSFATIAKEFDIDPIRLKNLLWGFGFGNGKRTRALSTCEIGYFPAAESEAKIREMLDVVDRVEAAKRLNINGPLFDRLRKIGVIQPAATFEGLKGLYQPDHLDEVLARFLDRAEAVDNLIGKQMDIGVACNKAKVKIEYVVPMILDGRLKWLGRQKSVEGLAALAVDLEEILDLFEGPPLQGYTKQELKRLLRVNDPTITHLIQEKYIRAQKTRHPRSRRPMSIIPHEAYDAFLKRYVTLGILAHQIGTQAKHVSSRLEKLKIDPIQMAPRFSKIYEREKLDGLIEGDRWASGPSLQTEGC